MAKAPDGILGPVHGSVGNFTFYKLNGQSIVRKKAEFTDKPSTAQLNARSSMKVLMNFFTRIKPFLKAGFINKSRGTVRSYFNMAIFYNLKQALLQGENGYAIEFPKIKLSEGTIAPADQVAVTLTTDGLLFSWHADPEISWSSQNDQAMMMAYFPEQETGIYQISGARRNIGQDVLPLPGSYLDKSMEVYLAFIADDRCSVSDSQYLGRIN